MNLNLAGLPVSISPWSVLLAILVGVGSLSYIKLEVKKHLPNQQSSAILVVAAITSIAVVFVSIILHEIAHGIAMSLVDIPIESAGITGWGAFVAPNIESWESISPWAMAFVAIVGPLTNLIIGLVLVLVVMLNPESISENTVQYLAMINLALFRFNMFPFIFFDGGKFAEGISRGISGSTDGTFYYVTLILLSILLLIYGFQGPVKKLEQKLKML